MKGDLSDKQAGLQVDVFPAQRDGLGDPMPVAVDSWEIRGLLQGPAARQQDVIWGVRFRIACRHDLRRLLEETELGTQSRSRLCRRHV